MSSRVARRTVGTLVLLGIATSLVIVRCHHQADRGRDWLAHGVGELAIGLEGDPSAFGRAQAALAKAAGGVVFDPYPVMVLEASRVLAGPDSGLDGVAMQVRPIFVLWRERRFDEALIAAAALPDTLNGAAMVTRLATELVRAKRSVQPEP